jgi:hypothetical protein
MCDLFPDVRKLAPALTHLITVFQIEKYSFPLANILRQKEIRHYIKPRSCLNNRELLKCFSFFQGMQVDEAFAIFAASRYLLVF